MTSKTEVQFSSNKAAYSLLKNKLEGSDKWVLILDQNTDLHCKKIFLQKLSASPNLEIILEVGESSKNLSQIEVIYNKIIEKKIGRNAMLVNLGGGIVSDMGGFAAATYKRGIEYINIPTTLLAMVDAAMGGKTGVNFKGIKNQIGSFHQASFVLIDETYLTTLSDYDLISGFAEIIKHALIADKALWKDLSSIVDIKTISEREVLIRKAIEIKSNIVESDPFEKGNRKLLNFGHTIGHAIEALFNDKNQSISHGHAVAIGMICESNLSFQKEFITALEMEEITTYINSVFKHLDLDEALFDQLIEAMFHDKKNHGALLNFTLLSAIGTGMIDQTCDIESVKKALLYYKNIR